MEILIWLGTALSFIGLIGLVWCIVTVWKAKRAKMEDAALRDRVRKVLPLNTAALFLSVIGLMLVIMGIVLSS